MAALENDSPIQLQQRNVPSHGEMKVVTEWTDSVLGHLLLLLQLACLFTVKFYSYPPSFYYLDLKTTGVFRLVYDTTLLQNV